MSQDLSPRPPLFRLEAVEFQQRHRQWGRVVALQPLSGRIMAWALAAAVAAIVAFLVLAQYARKETVPGFLAPASGTARIFAPQQGVISAVHVEQGQRVEEGQPLLGVTLDQVAASGEDVHAAILASLGRQKASLALQTAAEDARAASERGRLAAQLQTLETGLVQLGAQIAIQQERIRAAERLVASGSALARRGLVSELDQQRREEALLEQRLNLNIRQLQVTEREGQRTDTRYALEQLPAVAAEKAQALRNELAGVEQRIAEVDGRRAYVVRAPIAGRVSSLQASVGQPADPRRLQLQIVPSDGALQAEMFVPAQAIGFVEVGQEVRFRYDAFPYQHHGSHRGRIVRISETVLEASDIAVPLALAGPAYRAVAALERPTVAAQGRQIALQPDMLLKADIILERRRLMRWILDPLLSAGFRG